MLSFLTQERFPRLWLLFQALFGATREKQRLVLHYLADHTHVVEIGCSLGIVADAFSKFENVNYLGIDIDAQAIKQAKARFSTVKNLSFSTQSIADLAKENRHFDYVLFANILHHVDDDTAVTLISQASKLIAPGGVMVIMEPDVLRPDDSLLIRLLYKLERGQYRRPPRALEWLMHAAGVHPTKFRSEDVSIDTLPWFVCGHLLIYTVERQKAD